MKYKVGVFGSAAGDMSFAMPKALEIGKALGRYADKVVVITGACTGLPYVAAKAAAEAGVEVWGYSSSLDMEALREEYPEDDLTIYKKIIYVPEDFPFAEVDRVRKKYRNVISTANCDAGIIISGRWGSLNEFTNLIDFQKTVGVLTNSGGVADEISNLAQKISKEGQGHLLIDVNPQILVEKLISQLETV